MKKNLEILQNIEGDIGAYPTLQYRKKKLAVKINTKIPCRKLMKYCTYTPFVIGHPYLTIIVHLALFASFMCTWTT